MRLRSPGRSQGGTPAQAHHALWITLFSMLYGDKDGFSRAPAFRELLIKIRTEQRPCSQGQSLSQTAYTQRGGQRLWMYLLQITN